MNESEVFRMRDKYSEISDFEIEHNINLYKFYIENYTQAIGRWRDCIKLLETILDERAES